MPKFLCTADLHIGRQSSGFEGETALGALGRIVDLAVAEKADALLIAGDLFDSIDAQYQTRAQVAANFERLKSNGIPAIAVSGNHDWDAMPTFVHVYPGLIDLLGAKDWDLREVAGVAIIGRSFEDMRSKTLIDSFRVLAESRVTVGILHADIDTVSPYNPTPLNSLANRGVHAWVLGHRHACRRWDSPLAVYPGSPQALDAGESGIHGVRWLTVDGAKAACSETIPLSTVRFESISIELGADETIDDAVTKHLKQIRTADERLSVRVKIVKPRGSIPSIPEGIVPLGLDFYEVIDVSDAISRELDLEAEALQTDARGQAARLLLGLDERGNPAWIKQAMELVSQVRSEMEVNRAKLKLGPREEFQQLAFPYDDESTRAVRASLEAVLAASGGRT